MMMITGGGVTCVVCGVVVLVIVVVGVARIIAQCLNEELVVVDAEGIDDVGEGASGGRRGSRHDSIFIGYIMCPRNCN